MDSRTVNAKPDDLSAWESYLYAINPNIIKLGLDRIKSVAHHMGVAEFPESRVITVAGTNGKGSTATMIAGALTACGIKTGLYTSPHILNFNERIAIDGSCASPFSLCEAFSAVYDACAETGIELTFFEYTTLAAFYLFKKNNCQVLVLEVGLGGRLDAVNILDCDIAVIPSIGLDHCALLGNTEEAIAGEKAGIIKSGTTQVILGYMSEGARRVITETAERVTGRKDCMQLLGENLEVEYTDNTHFNLIKPFRVDGVTVPTLPLINAPLSLTAVLFIAESLKNITGLHISTEAILKGIEKARLHGRVETVSENPCVILDVAHNPPAMRYLASVLRNRGEKIRYAVIGMLKDKDIVSSLREISGLFSRIYVCSLPGERGSTASHVKDSLIEAGYSACQISDFDTVKEAYAKALTELPSGGELIVCGSFVTAEELLKSEPELRRSIGMQG